jgi:hypothetical protein
MEECAMRDSDDRPEVQITAWKVHLRGKSAIDAAGWTIRLAMVCRAVSALTLPWLSYWVWHSWFSWGQHS